MTHDVPTTATMTGRSTAGTAALLFAAVSAVALVIMIIASSAGVEGFTSDGVSTPVADTTWLCFSVGALLALVVGIFAWLRGRRRHLVEDVRAGQIAVGYVVLALISMVVSAALTGS